MINKRYKKGYAVVIVLCLIFMAVGAKFDWAATDFLYNPKNVFGIIFEAFSFFPMYLFIPVLGACLMVRNGGNMTTFAIGTFVLIASCCRFMYFASASMTGRAFIEKVNPYLCGIFGGILAALIFIAIRGCKRRTVRKIQAMCAFAAMYFLSYLSVIFVLKKIFGRDRYEDIITGGDFAFADWFKPAFFTSGSSFPSGHTAAAMGIVLLLLLPFLFAGFKKLKAVLFVFCYLYVALVAFSRLIMGRHFISDTAAAILIMTLVFMALTPYFEKLYRKLLIKQN